MTAPAEDCGDPMFKVVKNAEAVHSLWPQAKPVPEGWQETGAQGSEQDCLADIAARWEGPTGAVPQHGPATCLHERFEERAREDGEAVALVDGSRTVTYRELNRAANQLAHRLRNSGVGPESLVGVCARRGAELVVALLAVLKAGGGYLPLDPDYPGERLRYIVEDAGCRIVVGPEALRGTVEAPEWVALDDANLTALPEDDLESGAAPGNVAYVIYTSGSTGAPKGVLVSHANVTRLFEATEEEFGFGRDDVWTLFHSFAFDFSVWELWGALLYGGRLVVVSYPTSRDPEAFLRLVRGEGVTVLNQTPSAFRQLSRAAELASWPALPLRLVVFGGERLELAGLSAWWEHYGDTSPQLVNMYGITETTVHVTLRPLAKADLDRTVSPIGRPLADLSLHVLDGNLDPVPPGTRGELFVGGAGVSRGYRGRPELTAQRFLPDPFGPPGARMYRTGDVGSAADNAEYLFHGRADDQVQLHGFRIEPGEVEATVLRHSEVRDCAVAVVERASGEPVLACYWSPAPDATVTSAELRAAFADQLPAHMVPSAFIRLNALPMTANGKLDTAQLPGLRDAERAGEADLAAPRTETEHALALVWREVLDLDVVGVDDNFFTIGGDSITALPLVQKAEEAGVPFAIEDLFAYPTIAELAERVATRDIGSAPVASREESALLPESYLRTLPPEVEAAYPASALQGGIILHSMMSGDPTLYHDLGSVRVRGLLDPGALDRAWRRLTGRHELLRSAFDLTGHRVPVYQVHRSVDVPVEILDAQHQDPAESVRDWWRMQWKRGFDLAAAPLVRCHVHDFADGSFQLSVSAHHSVLDGWSFSVLLSELLTTYDNELGGTPSADAPALPFREFVALEQQATASEPAKQYWQQVLKGAEPLSFSPAAATASAGEPLPDPDVTIVLESGLTHRIEELAASVGTSVKSVCLAAHLAALRRLTGREDVVTGLVASGRPERAHAQRSIGVFLNSVPVRADLAGQTWRTLVRHVSEAERDLMPHRRFPLVEIQRTTGQEPFAVLFNFTSMYVLDLRDRLSRIAASDWWFSDHNNLAVNVEVDCDPESGRWQLSVRVDRRRVSPDIAGRLAELINEALGECVDSPDSPLSREG
ncbi:amino acid adenylation domain-containing protein [Streptomyces sp. 2A115]|uniref:amino acid adenylation domain-containing protein n=1 Tax=Streptomyces sp. 2A115 TaxID=3457439 RepID=UPI003FD57E8E